MKRKLAIDYGDVRVGLAISDELLLTAQGLDTLVINHNDENFFRGVEKIFSKYDIDTIVIGYPKNMDGTMSEKTKKVDSLIPRLKNICKNVIKWDERLTTVSAYNTMRELNISQKSKNKYADKLAATYILQGYLDSIISN